MVKILTKETALSVRVCADCRATYVRKGVSDLPCVICEGTRILHFPPTSLFVNALISWLYCDTCGLIRLVPGDTGRACHYCPTGHTKQFDAGLIIDLRLTVSGGEGLELATD